MSTNDPNARYSAYIVTEGKEPDGESYWNRVATVFPHRKGDGFDLVIPPGIALSGRITIRKDKDKDKDQAPTDAGHRDQ